MLNLRTRTPKTSEKVFVLLVSPSMFFLLYDLLFYWTWIALDNQNKASAYLMTYYTLFNILFICLTYKNIFYKNIKYFIHPEKKINIKANIIGVTFSGLSILTVFVYLDGNISFDLSESYTRKSEKGASLVFLNSVFIYCALFFVFKYKLHAISHTTIISAILFSIFMGGRSGVIVSLILFVFFASKHHNIKIRKIAVFMVALMALFISSSISRGTISIENQELVLQALDYNQLFTLDETIKYTSENGPKIHLYLKDVIDGFIPRSINPDKNTSTAFTREVFPWVWEKTSYTAGFYANMIFVFGFLGIFITPFFIYLVNFLFWKSIHSKSTNGSIFIIICFTICPVLIVRGGIFEQRIVIIMFLIVLSIFLSKALMKKISIIRRPYRTYNSASTSKI